MTTAQNIVVLLVSSVSYSSACITPSFVQHEAVPRCSHSCGGCVCMYVSAGTAVVDVSPRAHWASGNSSTNERQSRCVRVQQSLRQRHRRRIPGGHRGSQGSAPRRHQSVRGSRNGNCCNFTAPLCVQRSGPLVVTETLCEHVFCTQTRVYCDMHVLLTWYLYACACLWQLDDSDGDGNPITCLRSQRAQFNSAPLIRCV